MLKCWCLYCSHPWPRLILRLVSVYKLKILKNIKVIKKQWCFSFSFLFSFLMRLGIGKWVTPSYVISARINSHWQQTGLVCLAFLHRSNKLVLPRPADPAGPTDRPSFKRISISIKIQHNQIKFNTNVNTILTISQLHQ